MKATTKKYLYTYIIQPSCTEIHIVHYESADETRLIRTNTIQVRFCTLQHAALINIEKQG